MLPGAILAGLQRLAGNVQAGLRGPEVCLQPAASSSHPGGVGGEGGRERGREGAWELGSLSYWLPRTPGPNPSHHVEADLPPLAPPSVTPVSPCDTVSSLSHPASPRHCRQLLSPLPLSGSSGALTCGVPGGVCPTVPRGFEKRASVGTGHCRSGSGAQLPAPGL